MLRHSNSFLLSLFIHALLALGVYGAYKSSESFFSQPKEQTTLISLYCLRTEKVPQAMPLPQPVIKQAEKPRKKTIEKPLQEPIKKVHKTTQPVAVVKEQPMAVTPTIEPSKVPLQSTVVEKKEYFKEQEYLELHIAKISKLIKENMYYPRRARKKGLEDTVLMRFQLSTQGKISKIEVLEAKEDILAQAAISTIEELDELLPHPEETLTLTIPMDYNLND